MPDIETLISRWATQDYDLGPTDYESLADNQLQHTATACVIIFSVTPDFISCLLL